MNVVVNVIYETTCKYNPANRHFDFLTTLTTKPTYREDSIVWIFIALEEDVALICASAPAFKPLFKRNFSGTTNFHAMSSHHRYRRQTSRTRAKSADFEGWSRFAEQVELD